MALFFTEGSGGQYSEEKGALAGVEVRVDGALVAQSDEDGVALVSLPRKPDKLECSLAGWRVQDNPSGEIELDEQLCPFLVLARE
jgi:hypothetical protein